jgi:hypothetical protein
MSTIVINATHRPEDPERATLPFVVGNVAASAGITDKDMRDGARIVSAMQVVEEFPAAARTLSF